jgi:hypothetical protein
MSVQLKKNRGVITSRVSHSAQGSSMENGKQVQFGYTAHETPFVCNGIQFNYCNPTVGKGLETSRKYVHVGGARHIYRTQRQYGTGNKGYYKRKMNLESHPGVSGPKLAPRELPPQIFKKKEIKEQPDVKHIDFNQLMREAREFLRDDIDKDEWCMMRVLMIG